MKTAKQIQEDVIDLLRGSTLREQVTGGVYPGGLRPRDSRLEDIEVIFTLGNPGQIESGVVTINVFCPDVPEGLTQGAKVENARRTREIERLLAEWVETLTPATTGGYLFTPASTILTLPEEETDQHFTSVKLKYRYYDN
ncbi:MAG: hypothetical protein PUK60_01930 [Bacteroidales bacterium]|nr:hypothetical protein [Bacteroidales bacterium]